MEHFGKGQPIISFFSGGDGVDDFIDAVEIVAENASTQMFDNRKNRVADPGRGRAHQSRVRPVPFRLSNAGRRDPQDWLARFRGDARRPGPARRATARMGSGRTHLPEAIHHQLSGEVDDALTSASSAVESALKADRHERLDTQGARSLVQVIRLRTRLFGDVPALLEDFLDRLHALRSTEGDAHGKLRAADPEAALADLAIHLAGSFIVYLAGIVPQDESSTRNTAQAPARRTSGPRIEIRRRADRTGGALWRASWRHSLYSLAAASTSGEVRIRERSPSWPRGSIPATRFTSVFKRFPATRSLGM